MEPTRREQREQKRLMKRAGGQRRRRSWKEQLAREPDEAPAAEFDFGRSSSAGLNGLDHDATRRRKRPNHADAPPEPPPKRP